MIQELMTENDYRNVDAINYSKLANFKKSPSHCLMPQIQKGYFTIGRAFELIVEGTAKKQPLSLFEKEFIVCDIEKPVPDRLYQALNDKQDIKDLYIYNKNGSLSKTHKTLHTYIDILVAYDPKGKKTPINTIQYNMLKLMLKNLQNLEVFDRNIFEFLSHENTMFQVPILWYTQYGKKKALLDYLYIDNNRAIVFDIKTSYDPTGFKRMIYDKYWIQDIHYKEAVQYSFDDVFSVDFVFIVSNKEVPYISQPFTIQYSSKDSNKTYEYNHLCENYSNWIKAGKNDTGCLPLEKITM